MIDINAELLDAVRRLTDRVESLETEVKSIKLLNAQTIPEETMVAIAAAVAAYLGHRAKRRQAHFTTTKNWVTVNRPAQHIHTPLYLR